MVIRRHWIQRVEAAWDRRSVVWLHGVRRIGKTTLCKSLDDMVHFDCEMPSVRRQLDEPERFFGDLRGARVAVDEIHRLPRASEILKIAADHFADIRVIATGSFTLAAKAKLADTLTGRKTSVWLTPLMSDGLRDFQAERLTDRLWYGGILRFSWSGRMPGLRNTKSDSIHFGLGMYRSCSAWKDVARSCASWNCCWSRAVASSKRAPMQARARSAARPYPTTWACSKWS